jgi:subtilisin family serine protease
VQKQLIAAAIAATCLTTASASDAASYIVVGNGANLDAAVRAAGGVVTNRLPAIDAVVADSGSSSFKQKLGKTAGIQSVVPNLTIDWYRGEQRPTEMVFGNPPNSADDDFYFDLQWGHDAVNAAEAWNAGYRGLGARVAVLDGGFHTAHPDIQPNFDSSCSADFTGEGLQYGPNVDDPEGVFSHGTHVAGTIAAADNDYGVIGVAPEAKLCLVKVLFNSGSGSFEDVAAGIVWAADQAVDVVNMSLGSAIFKNGESGLYTAREAAELKNFINRAVTYAHQKGVLVVTSAGNEAIDGDKDKALIHLPSDASHAISIAATAPVGWGKDPTVSLDNPASYSNYGRSVIGLAAPGGDFLYYFSDPSIPSCTVAGVNNDCYVFDYVFSTGGAGGGTDGDGVAVPESDYFFWSAGTSMAAPHASGVAALAVSRYGKMAPAQLRTILERGADDLGQRGNDPFFGAGRVNAENSTQ